MTWEALEKAGADLLRTRGPAALRAVVEYAMEGRPREAILRAAPYSAPLLDALAEVDRSAGLAYVTGLAAGYAQRAAEVSVETVWSGPGRITSRSGPPPLSWPTSSGRPAANCC